MNDMRLSHVPSMPANFGMEDDDLDDEPNAESRYHFRPCNNAAIPNVPTTSEEPSSNEALDSPEARI